MDAGDTGIPPAAGETHSSPAHMAHTLGHKAGLNFRKTEIVSAIFLDRSGMKLKVTGLLENSEIYASKSASPENRWSEKKWNRNPGSFLRPRKMEHKVPRLQGATETMLLGRIKEKENLREATFSQFKDV